MHRILVEEKRWIGEGRFLHALNYCMLLPGPEATQLAIYIGWLLHRTWGGLVAGDPVRAAGIRRDHGPELALRRAWQGAGGRGAVLRPQGGGAGDRARGGRAHRPPGAAEPGHARARRCRLRRHLLLRRPLPADHPRGRADRSRGSPGRAACLHCRRRAAKARRYHDQRCRIGARRGHARACPPGACLVAAGGGRLPAAVARTGPGAAADARRRRRVQPGSRCSSARWRSSPSAAPTPCWPTSRSRRSRPTAGSSPARCWMAWAWPRPRPAR